MAAYRQLVGASVPTRRAAALVGVSRTSVYRNLPHRKTASPWCPRTSSATRNAPRSWLR